MRGERSASAPSIVPSVVSTPARWSSAIASMIPEPQTPVTCVPANAGSSDHASHPITRMRGSSVSGSMRTRSIAPGAARWPHEICAPSNAGPGRARGGEQSVAVAEDDLGVGPDVDDEVHLVPEVRALGEDDAGRVGADVPRDAGQHVRTSAPVNRESRGPERAGGRPRRS